VKLKGYRIFTIESEGILHPKLFISENNGKRYAIKRIGIFNKRFEFYRKGKKKMELEIKHHFLKKKIYISQFGKIVAAFSPKVFSSSFTIDTHYGGYHVIKDSLLSDSFTISNSTTEVVKISSKGLLPKKHGMAIHSNEHVEFLICLSFYIVHRLKKKKKSK